MVDIRLFGVNCARSGHSQGLPPSSSTASPSWDDRRARPANPGHIQATATARSPWTPTKVPSFMMTIHSSCSSARERGCGLWFVGNHTRQGEVTRRKAGSRSWRTSASKASQDSVQAKEALINHAYFARRIKGGFSRTKIPSEGGKLKDKWDSGGLVWCLRRRFSAPGDTTPTAGPTA
jgi:hypothetical protein